MGEKNMSLVPIPDGRLPKRIGRPKMPLPEWSYKFATWFMNLTEPPSIEVQVQVANWLANEGIPPNVPRQTITYEQVKRIRRRDDWRAYLELIHAGGMEAARAMFLSDMPMYARLHSWAAQRLKEKDDPKSMAAFTVPALDRYLPKREDKAAETRVTIHLSASQLKGFNQPPIEVECVELPIPTDNPPPEAH